MATQNSRLRLAQNGALRCHFLHRMLLKFTHPVHLGILLDPSMHQTWIDISVRLSGKIPVPREVFAPSKERIFFCTVTICSVLRAMSQCRWGNATLGLATVICFP
jgi:hypothetical protein